ncbi:MAG TPA: hypothetical protein VFJ58_12925 [Armatimonadota bacterium]|nr:hypothetical protein [Armatimonadota bacterium]
MTARAVAAALVGSVMLAAVGAACADAPPPNLTADQAILIARDYCKSIGQPVTMPGTATFPVPADPDLARGEPDIYWRARWKVSFQDQATVQVVDETGSVNDYRNQIWQYNLQPVPASATEVTADEAVRIATDALRSTGQQMAEYALSGANPDRSSAPPDRVWHVVFDRVFRGIPYASQGASVMVQYRGGIVDGLSLYCPSPPAAPSTIRFDAGHAAQKALERISQLGVRSALVYSEDTEYVVPADPRTNGLPRTDFVPPRLAWVVRVVMDGYSMDERIDAETGDVLGEETYMPGGSIKTGKARKTAAQILADAKEVKVERRTDKYEWPKKPTAVLSETSQPEMFKLLKASEPSSIKNLLVAPEFQLEVTTSAASPTNLYYLPDRNLVGNGVDWLTAPVEFKTWMEKLKPAAK